MPIQVTRPRLIVAVAFVLIALAFLLGVVAAPPPAEVGAAVRQSGPPSGPSLLVSEFSDSRSQLWLIDPQDPNERDAFLAVNHAPGWALSGAVSPDGATLAYVVLRPGRRDAETEASLWRSDGGAPVLLVDGVDLGGGVVWSADGASILVRRTTVAEDGRRAFAVVEVDLATGRAVTHPVEGAAAAVHVVGRAGDGSLLVELTTRSGSRLSNLGDPEDKARLLSNDLTRDWRLSPDGAQLAFTEQAGLTMAVRVIALDPSLTSAGLPAMRAATAAGQALLDEGNVGVGTAAPVWSPDGALSVGVFQTPVSSGDEIRVASVGSGAGFALPLAWSADGAHLAVRAFDGGGPGSSTRESVGIVGSDGALVTLPGGHMQVLGWWNGAR